MLVWQEWGLSHSAGGNRFGRNRFVIVECFEVNRCFKVNRGFEQIRRAKTIVWS